MNRSLLGLIIILVLATTQLNCQRQPTTPEETIEIDPKISSTSINPSEKISSAKPKTPSVIVPTTKSPKKLITDAVHHAKHYTDWIWQVKPEFQTGTKVKLEIAHAAAGDTGGFSMIAYVDSNNDGKPDKLIAESPPLVAKEKGEWSEWEFETEEEPLFVGFRWPINNYIYRRGGSWPNGKFSENFFYGLKANKFISAGPAFSNMEISFSE